MTDRVRTVCKKVDAEWVDEAPDKQIQRAFPDWGQTSFDPFILLDDFVIWGDGGFPYHAHMGFEKITYVIEGQLAHHDSMGNDSVIGTGGAHWLMTGRQVEHSELASEGMRTRGIQLWVNIPQSYKHAKAMFRATASADELPVHPFEGGQITEIAGNKSPLQLLTPVLLYEISCTTDATCRVDVPDGYTTLVYGIFGTGKLGSVQCQPGQLLVLDSQGAVNITATAGFRGLVMAGLPLHEPIHLMGSFVD